MDVSGTMGALVILMMTDGNDIMTAACRKIIKTLVKFEVVIIKTEILFVYVSFSWRYL